MSGRFLAVLSPLLLAGCASAQLNYNTDDVTANFEKVYIDQALNNLSAFIDDKNAIPSQIDVSGGTIQTVNTVTPSVTFPFTNMIANSVNAGVLSRTATLSGSGATLGASNAAQQNYNVVPVIDGNALRNLQAIYQYAVWSAPLLGRYKPLRIYFNNRFYADPFQISLPQCVLCEKGAYNGALLENPQLVPNPKLRPGWLIWTTASGALNRPLRLGETLHDLGHYGAHQLFTTEDDFKAGVVTDFVFFIMPVEQPAETFNPPTAAGSPQNGAASPQKQAAAHGPGQPNEGGRAIKETPGRTLTFEVEGEVLKQGNGALKPESDKGRKPTEKSTVRVTLPAEMLAPAPTIIVPQQIAPSTNGSVYGGGRDPRRSPILPGIQP